ncbi:uncharacterized protein LOC143914270 [Arctopsyche grandis]|uniref:uncharacterized protein LOC143914270 n=1 Tax=Arctopsyche grandis TaxID=121162 RepID=UPI00406D9C1F
MAATHTCSICDSNFTDKQQLQDHFRAHAVSTSTPSKNRFMKMPKCPTVECDVCPAKFYTASQAVYHKFKYHGSNTLRYYCAWCGKQFTIKQMHETHIKLDHIAKSNNKPKQRCDQCEAVFYKKNTLDRHLDQFHKQDYNLQHIHVLPPSKKIVINSVGDVQSAFYCHFCGQEYILKYNLQKHLKEIHSAPHLKVHETPNELFKCSTCDALFYNEKAFDTHKIFHNTGDLYVTSEEMRLNVVTKVDQDFDVRRVRSHLNPLKPPPMKKIKIESTSTLQEDMSKFSPPPSDCSDSEIDEDQSRTKSQELDIKPAISLNEFLDMHKEIFDGKTCDAGNKKSSSPEKKAIPNLKNEIFIKEEYEETTLYQNVKKENENESDSLKAVGNKTNGSNNKCVLKAISKDKLENLKSKGLIKITSKSQLSNLKKIGIVPELLNSGQKNNIVVKSLVTTEKECVPRNTNPNANLYSNLLKIKNFENDKILSKCNPSFNITKELRVTLTRIDMKNFPTNNTK